MRSPGKPPVRAIAFYLPQFHPIPENDAWWGKGFTEWTNVSRAKPLFDGHYQPRLPADLGFYDLRLPQVLEAQADLARSYGIYGFCYYFYFFKDGKRLLEQPIEQMLRSGKPDFPFCLCWANENWTRRWDGLDQEILQAQEHSPAGDRAFMQCVLPYFRDPRYIRIDGRPVIMIYRASLFPDFADTVRRWRAQLHEQAEAPPYVIVAETYDLRSDVTARADIDATCEFPPHGDFSRALGDFPVRFFSPFSGWLYDYDRVVDHFLQRPTPDRRRFKTVALGWDNTARKKSSAVILGNFSLAAYHRWLAGAIDHTQRTAPEGERFVFINAWNEWAEGTYLEPDLHFGHAFLEATRAALSGQPYDPRSLVRQRTSAVLLAGQRDEPVPAQSSGGKMSALAVAVAGDDGDLIEAFARENLRLLDRLVVAVHRSLKRTFAILEALVEEGMPISVRALDDRQSNPREALNALLRDALADPDLAWIVPLATDEFVDAADRSELRSALAASARRHAHLPVITHMPTPFDDPGEPHPLKRIRHRYAEEASDGKADPRIRKLIVNCGLLRRYADRYELDEGGHLIVFRGTDDRVRQPVAELPGIVLRRFPVRMKSARSGAPLIADPFPVSAGLRYMELTRSTPPASR